MLEQATPSNDVVRQIFENTSKVILLKSNKRIEKTEESVRLNTEEKFFGVFNITAEILMPDLKLISKGLIDDIPGLELDDMPLDSRVFDYANARYNLNANINRTFGYLYGKAFINTRFDFYKQEHEDFSDRMAFTYMCKRAALFNAVPNTVSLVNGEILTFNWFEENKKQKYNPRKGKTWRQQDNQQPSLVSKISRMTWNGRR